MSTIESITGSEMDRRKFITRTAVGLGGALVVGIELSPGTVWANNDLVAATAGGSFGVYVTVNPDETITLVCPGSEMDQGIATSLLLHLIAEARRLEVYTLFLQAVHHGPAQPLYSRLGFQTAFVRAWYLPDVPGGIWTRRER